MLRRPAHVSLQALRRMYTATDEVVVQTIGDKGVITLNRPKALNALNLNMIRQITPVLEQWDKDKSLIIMKGAGEKAFCAGGDVRAVTEAAKTGDRFAYDFFYGEYQLNALINRLKVPYVALIDGITMGGGVGLSVHGRFRVATEKTLFAMPETAIGLFPDVGGSYFLSRLPGRLGHYLALTGYRLKGPDVLHAGVATHIVHSEKLAELEAALIAEKDPAGVLNSFNDADLAGRPFSLAPTLQDIDATFAPESVEEILQKLESNGSEWAKKTAATLNKMSPTSLKITMKQLRLGKQKNLQECLQMEFRLTQRCCAGHDFIEGVRSVLVDRDNNPKWKPATLAEVSDATIDSYFAPLPSGEELDFSLKSAI
ncbi:3-hydroxyisobutyryl-CoA hydrolase, mitochondrial [Neocloeon triangulifer]|uniref:3-hydroxyisobutyryl-CoA hydrolase, mitochondrial n=1 Tax=Neocloeon triangulifer TaxID=2078957 RepID=UPI00286F5EEC|nr:3-hydroxyisobutyryl-CoA hydrolase, mitochondrial [Neocloeon triangulifer]